MYKCINDSNVTLSNCQRNPNIRIQKIHHGDHIESYKLSLHSQNAWWAPTAENDKFKWIKCGDLCKVCPSLPGIGENGENIWPAS